MATPVNPLPVTMRVIHQPNPHSTNLIMTEGPIPRPQGPSDLLIKVVATSPCLGELHWAAVFGDDEARARNGGVAVFVAGAGTSVGTWAVQFAALAGARKTHVEAWVGGSPDREVDLVVDCVGGASMGGLWSVVKNGGTFLSICADPDSVKPAQNSKTLEKAEWFIVESLGEQLGDIAQLVEAGRARPVIDSVIPFEQFQEAFDKVESRKTKGKVIIRVAS
ncbi:Lipase 1 [Verticillium dahliae VDG1]|nr:Lipase 1 [Verticillium dahliae VDG1]